MYNNEDSKARTEILPEYLPYKKLFDIRGAFESKVNYRIRVEHLAQTFSKRPEDEQAFIRAAREDGMTWRGHDFDFFKLAYEEHMKMQRMTNDEKMAYVKSKVSTLPTFEMPKAKSKKPTDPYSGLYQ